MSGLKEKMIIPKKNRELSLVDAWSDSLTREDLERLLIDCSEVGLDAILDDGLAKDIPFISCVVSVYKIGHSIKERWYIRKLIVFLEKMRSENLDEKERKKYYDRITKDKRATQRELEYVLLLLDRLSSERKVSFLAKLYLSFWRGEIDWQQFCQFSEVVDRLLPGDEACMNVCVLEDKTRKDMDNCAIQRLQGLGLLTPVLKPSSYDIHGNILSTRNDGTYALTTFGKTLARIILEN